MIDMEITCILSCEQTLFMSWRPSWDWNSSISTNLSEHQMLINIQAMQMNFARVLTSALKFQSPGKRTQVKDLCKWNKHLQSAQLPTLGHLISESTIIRRLESYIPVLKICSFMNTVNHSFLNTINLFTYNGEKYNSTQHIFFTHENKK